MQFANLVNGQWVEAAESRPNINPSDTTDVIGSYASGTASDVDAAVDAATAASICCLMRGSRYNAMCS